MIEFIWFHLAGFRLIFTLALDNKVFVSLCLFGWIGEVATDLFKVLLKFGRSA